jgi:Ser/Thr protein kinase RdoA (MazF antagonist)
VDDIGAHFEIAGRPVLLERYGSGHIHDTFRLRCDAADSQRSYLLQRINDRVFRDPIALMDNLARVCDHQRRRISARGQDPSRRSLQLVAARDGGPAWVDGDGAHWRCFVFIEGTRSIDVVADAAQAFETARAFAGFVADLADLEGPALAETIPRFHDLEARYAAFEASVGRDAHARVAGMEAEIDDARGAHARLLATLAAADADGLPLRTVHNDCKINNVLLDAAADEALCVIDLDTTMEGTVLHDFGELMRTSSCRSAEDTRDLGGMTVEPELLRAVTRGYLAGSQAFLTAAEKRALPGAGARMALENALRFATDHLEGDRYFRVGRPDHNRDRFRAQLRLATLLHERTDEVAEAIASQP